MSSTKELYDNCKTVQDFEQCYKRPNFNMFQTYKYQHPKPVRNKMGIISGNEVSVSNNIIDLESDLLGMNKYKDNNNKPIYDGSICSDEISFRNVSVDYNNIRNASTQNGNSRFSSLPTNARTPVNLNAQLNHLQNGQMIDYQSYKLPVYSIHDTFRGKGYSSSEYKPN